MTHPAFRAEETRSAWASILETCDGDPGAPCDTDRRSEKDTRSRNRFRAVRDEKPACVAPSQRENRTVDWRRLGRPGPAPGDLARADSRTVDWPVVARQETRDDAISRSPHGTCTTCVAASRVDRGRMLSSSTGSTGVQQGFRDTPFDRRSREQANARALHSRGPQKGDVGMPLAGFAPHVFAGGVRCALAGMGPRVIPRGGMNREGGAPPIKRFRPKAPIFAPSCLGDLVRVLPEVDPAPARNSATGPAIACAPFSEGAVTFVRIQGLWGATSVDFYGRTGTSPLRGGNSCPDIQNDDEPILRAMVDIRARDTVDPADLVPVVAGARGPTACPALNAKRPAQLRVVVGDAKRPSHGRCGRGRSHAVPSGGCTGYADDLTNLHGIKVFPEPNEEAVRAAPGTGDAGRIRGAPHDDGRDVDEVMVYPTDAGIAGSVSRTIRARCAILVGAVVAAGTLSKPEMKTKRVFDERNERCCPTR